MADPLSITASIITVLQFAGSVTSLCLSYRDVTKSRGGVLQELIDELKGLTDVLDPFAKLVDEHGQDTISFEALSKPSGALNECSSVLENLQTELTSTVAAQGMKKLGKILAWPMKEKEIRSLLKKLDHCKATLMLALHGVEIELGHVLGDKLTRIGDLLVGSQAEEKRAGVLQWLSAGDPSTRHSESCKKHQAGTGTWFLKRAEYVAWKIEASSLVWLHGIPGCGKTILSSTIIDDLAAYSSTTSDIALAYHYFDFSNADRNSVKNLMCSLLRQLSSCSPRLPSSVEALYYKYNGGEQQPKEKDLRDTLQNVIESFPHIYLVLDALDECTEREELMELLDGLLRQEIAGLHLLAASRKEIEIEDVLDLHHPVKVSLEGQEVDEDIKLHIRSRLARDLRLKRLADPVKVDIETALLHGAKGMFLWVDRQLDDLRECSRPAAIKRTLNSLPKDLDETYNRILLRIQKDEDSFTDAFAALRWLAVAVRPLTLSEVAEAVAIYPGCTSIDVDNRLFEARELLSICPGLVTLSDSGGTGRLHLSHFSVKEYLMSGRIRSGPASAFAFQEVHAHKYVSEMCLTYLLTFSDPDVFMASEPNDRTPYEILFERFLISGNESALRPTPRSPKKAKMIFEDFPLLRYAARYWTKHVRALPQNEVLDLNPQILDFMNPLKSPSFLNSVRASNPIMLGKYEFTAELHDLRPPLYYASLLGLTTVAHMMLEDGADVHGLRMYADPAMTSVRFNDSIGICIGGRTDSSGRGGLWHNPWRSPLHAAIQRGYQSVVELLISFGANVHGRDEHGRTALQVACAKSRYDIVNLLLEEGANINGAIDNSADLAAPVLRAAAFDGDEKLIRLLLERGAEVDAPTAGGDTALQEACAQGHYRIVELLIESGASINARGGFHGSALQAAAGMGHEDIVKLLLTLGAEVNATEGFSGSALQKAASCGEEDIVTLLLSSGADPNAKGRLGTALEEACRRKNSESIVKLLLDHGADVNSGTAGLDSPLQSATSSGNRALVCQLLDLGADINTSNGAGGRALQIAASIGDENLVDLLLSRGATVNMDPSGDLGFPLQAAAFGGSTTIVIRLLDAGSDVNAEGGKYWTALIAATFDGGQETICLLLDNGADVNALGGRYGTALIAAAYFGNEKVVQLFLDHGADVNLRSDRFGNAMAAAVRGHQGLYHERVVMLLEQHGATEIFMPENVDEEEDWDSDIDFSFLDEGGYRDTESVDSYDE